jgi:hypothetical protein
MAGAIWFSFKWHCANYIQHGFEWKALCQTIGFSRMTGSTKFCCSKAPSYQWFFAAYREMVQTYKPKNVPKVIAAKTGEFWSKTKWLPIETIDEYYNHFHELLDELSEAAEPISTKSAMHHFIFTLGSDFETIQKTCVLEIFLPSGILKIGRLFWFYVMIIFILSILMVFWNVSLLMMVVLPVQQIMLLNIRKQSSVF